MSDLRNQLQQAKDEYRSLHYPGDLASEMLQPKTRRWLWPLAVAAAAAAVVVMSVHVRVEKHPSPLASTTQNSLAVDYAISPQPPADMGLAPPACEFDLTPPSFSLSADVKQQSSTTKESV
jgi:hypothetical protein